MKKLLLCLLTLLLICCNKKTETPEALKAEVAKAEDDFKNLSQSKGIAEAFYAYADENAVIKRENDSLIQGKENIKNYYSNPKFLKATVTWEPDFVDVSADGTLGYTYGKYVWTVIDSLGAKKDFKGRFHTVWKRQKDGSWKYVWD
ncbi:nuclear transport factor 2 family protein [Flavobacterium sp. AS60]|uniref:YybH family protein n=1 Tax=Flavobacterium anseongense TaxID=2910677 RepID=UPI001F360D54|nr:nuclear transport factor 2 family protein [Flavobacterium sp. AS60]MCF6129046.1 nuclear transport factor 2 family protein [Flavobacterium sp. AS60]